MRLLKLCRNISKLKTISIRRYAQASLLENDDYTESPNYPPILDVSLHARKARAREVTYKNIQNLNTVEEKQIGLNMPRYYGWKCLILKEDDMVPYNALPMIKYYTKTHLIPIEKLPDTYKELSSRADLIVQEIKSLVEDAILIENEGVEYNFTPSSDFIDKEKSEIRQKENFLAKQIVQRINRIINNNLSDKATHILSSQVDYDPRIEAFWFVGGADVPWRVINWRKRYLYRKDGIYEPVNTPVQYLGLPFLTIRNQYPLKPLLPYSEAENPDFKVPEFKYCSGSVGYFNGHRHAANIPGFWPGDLDEYGSISFHGRGYLLDREPAFGEEDNLESIHCHGIQSSFGWLVAQANNLGFTTYNDITYPLVTQTIITNGQYVSFYLYQLNTFSMHIDELDNPKHNICYATKPLKLYDCIENGKVKGLNENVLKMIVQLYLNAPEKRDHIMKPYLDKEHVVAEIEDDERRCWLENTYKHVASNRPRHNLVPEVYLWENIYKIQFDTRPFEKKRRPFELGINPMARRLDEHVPQYIPKVLRPYPRCRKKFETTYYPKV